MRHNVISLNGLFFKCTKQNGPWQNKILIWFFHWLSKKICRLYHAFYGLEQPDIILLTVNNKLNEWHNGKETDLLCN